MTTHLSTDISTSIEERYSIYLSISGCYYKIGKLKPLIHEITNCMQHVRSMEFMSCGFQLLVYSSFQSLILGQAIKAAISLKYILSEVGGTPTIPAGAEIWYNNFNSIFWRYKVRLVEIKHFLLCYFSNLICNWYQNLSLFMGHFYDIFCSNKSKTLINTVGICTKIKFKFIRK